jgi:protoheme IX farnesyltransferase
MAEKNWVFSLSLWCSLNSRCGMKNNKLKFEFRHLLLAAAIMTYIVIVLGVMTRVTAGGSCPDWPTCYGSWTAPVQSSALLDYVHRTATVLAGILGLAALTWGWRKYRHVRLIFVPLFLSAIAFGTEIAVSAAGVHELLPTAIESSLHLGLALLVFGLQLMAVSVTFQKEIPSHFRFCSPFARLSLITLLAVFVLLVSGTLVSVTGATAYCEGWPLCDPQGLLGWLNLGHRAVVGVTSVLVTFLLIRAWQTQRSQPAVLVAATATAVLLVAQALMGAVDVARNFPPHLLALHLATSAAVFATATLSATFSGLARRTTEDERLERAEWLTRSAKRMAKDLLLLTKPIVVLLLLVTTYAGMVIGARAWPSLSLAFWTLLGGFMAAGGSGAINQYIDRKDDVRMQRTQKRPIPSGRLTPAEGLAFGVALSLGSFFVLVAFVNMLAALLSLAGIIYYVLLYSIFLKKTTVQNIVIGGGAGALPPLVGWAAATGSLNIPSLFLFAIVFMWTPPHFWALAIVRRKDYARAGVPMLPVVRGEAETRKQIFIYTVELVALTLLIPLFGLGGSIYFIGAAILGLWLLGAAWKVWKQDGNKVAWKMYRYSSMYLAFIFAALMVDALL